MAPLHAFLDNRGLQVKLHPGSHRRSHDADQHRQVTALQPETRPEHGFSRHQPVGARHDAGKNIANVEAARDKKHFLHGLIRAPHHQQPDKNRDRGHGEVFGDAENLEARRHAGKLPHYVRKIRQRQRHHHQKRDAESELFPDEISQTFPGHRAQARAHLLHHGEDDRDGDQGP